MRPNTGMFGVIHNQLHLRLDLLDNNVALFFTLLSPCTSLLSSLCLTSRLVKTLLYNFIRQEKCPPPATHIFEPKAEGGILYGLASGVASMCTQIGTPVKTVKQN